MKMIDQVIATGTITRTEYLWRAHLPDGTIRDSRPIADALTAFAAAFGRLHLPPGTRYERLRRTVTVTATPWEPAPAAGSKDQP